MISVKTQTVPVKSAVVEFATKVHRIFVIDCSGSMSGELPRVRAQLKNKLPQLTNIGDSISLIWFSSKGEAGILQEAVEIRSLTDFTSVNSAIDKWLRPMGLTGFVDPLKLVNDISAKVRGTGAVSMMFMTDGYDNQWSQPQIISAVKNLEVDSVTFVEFGYYCNRALMTKMADEVGGTLLFNESFEQYDDTFTALLTKPIRSGKKREVAIEGSAPLGYVFYLDDSNDVVTVIIENNKVLLPESVDTFGYVTDKVCDAPDADGLYIAAYTTAQRMLGNQTLDLLSLTGDVFFINMFSNCFSKQDYSEFQAKLKAAIVDDTLRLVDGQDFNAVPKPDAFTALDLIDMLANDDGNLFHPYNENFNYERIGVKRDQKNANVTEAEKEAILEKMKNAKTKEELDAANKELTDLLGAKHEYKFVPEVDDGGYSVDLVFNEDRPNVSIRVRVPGYVDIGSNAGLPKQFGTYIYRNFTMIKDGIKHSSLNCLPFELSKQTFDNLQANGLLGGETYEAGKIYLINAKKLPVINRNMAQSVSAKTFFEMCVEMNMIQSEQKVYNTFYKEKFPKSSQGFEMLYGKENAEWLKSVGITDYNGFNPPSVKGEVKDVYIAKEFQVKIAKCSSIPAINTKLFEKIEKTPEKITLSESLCLTAIKDAKKAEADTKTDYKTWLETRKKNAVEHSRAYILHIAKIKFAVSVGHVWFNEFSSMDENSMKVTVAGKEFECTAELRDIEVEC